MANGRTGTVFLEDFDFGVVTTFGAELVPIELDGEMVQDFAVRIDGVTGPDMWQGLVPVTFINPEDVYQYSVLPSIVISRSAVTPAMARWQPMGMDYMIPATSAKMVEGSGGVQAPSLVEIKYNAYPYDITYDIHLRGRRRIEADRMFRKIGRFYWAYGQVFLNDSEGEERGYYAFQESVDPLDEVADIADRMIGHTISIRVEGELDFNDPYIAPTTPRFSNRLRSKTNLITG